VLGFARRGDVVVVHTLDRLGRTVRDTVNLIRELTERGVGVRNLADPIKVDSADPDDPMGQVAVVLLALLARMDRTYTCERAAHARAVAAAYGRQVGRPSLLNPAVLAYAVHLRDAGHSMAQIVTETGMTRSSLYRYLPPRPPPLLTAAEPTHQGAVAPGLFWPVLCRSTSSASRVGVSLGLRPRSLPAARATARASRVRALIRSDSNSATMASTLNNSRPTGSVGSCTDPPSCRWTPRVVSSSTMSRASGSDRARRSSLVTARVSPVRQAARTSRSPGRARVVPVRPWST